MKLPDIMTIMGAGLLVLAPVCIELVHVSVGAIVDIMGLLLLAWAGLIKINIELNRLSDEAAQINAHATKPTEHLRVPK